MKKRVVGVTLLTVLCALLISNLVGVLLFRSQEISDARETLQELLLLLDAQGAASEPEQAVLEFSVAAPDKRLTIVGLDGTVLADTDASAAGLGGHDSRPEIERALLNGWGEATRHSETVGSNMLYVAKLLDNGCIGRAAMPLSSINSLVLRGVWGFLPASAAALLLSLLLARHSAERLAAPLKAVGGSLRAVLEDHPHPGLESYQADEDLQPILDTIDQLVERIGGYISSLTAERDKVSLILDCMDEGLLLLDVDGMVLAINRAARNLFGLTEDEFSSLPRLPHSQRLLAAVDEAREKGGTVTLDVDGLTEQSRSLRLFISPVTGRQFEGQPVGCSILISDVTQQKQAERIRAEFTANVSHELKTPLTSIKGFTDMISGGMVANPEDQKRFITMIGVEADRLIDLINDILRISELESVTIDQNADHSSVMDTARSAAGLLSLSAEKAGISISVTGVDARVPLPSGRLQELLVNLMENGIKYNEPGGRVETSIASDGGHAVITVSDTGIGIPPEATERVFERFYRVDKGRARKNGGTGLGLAIVKHIVRLYGGTVQLDSTVGKGSVFTITLPLAD